MKSTRKFISWLLVVAMLITCVPVISFAETQENAVNASKYIINDNFSQNNINGWTVYDTSKMSAADVVDSDDSTNYFMQITNSQAAVASGESDNLYVYKEMPNGGITYTENADVIIETRFKLVSDNARLFLKFDLDGTNDGINSNKNTFFVAKPNELNWRIKKSTWGDTGVTPVEETLVGQWLTAKVRIKGTSKTADYEISTANNTYTATSVDAKVFNNVTNAETGAIEMGDRLNNLAFRTWGKDEAVVDYVRVYKEYNASVSVSSIMTPDGSVGVTLDADEAPLNLADYVTLKDSTGTVDEYAELTQNANTLTVKTSKTVSDGDIFTVVVDKAGLEDLGYIFDDEATEFTVTASKYYMNDNFGSEDLNGWKVNGAKMSASAVADGDNNYAMQITNTQVPVASGESDNLYVYKEMPGNGITYTEDSDIIIETRVKVVSGNSGRIQMRFDLDGTNYQINSNKNVFFQVTSTKLNWRIASSWGSTDTTLPENIMNQWVDAKVRIKGTSKSADYAITVGDTTYTAEGPANVFSTEMGDALTNLAFSTFGSDSVAVDYIRVYRAYGASVAVPSTMTLDGSFGVTFDSQTVPSNLASYFTLKDSTGAVDENAEMTLSDNVLTVKASKEKIADGEKYTLVIDKAGLEDAGYFLTGDVTEYTVTASKYIINDDFGANDINGWNVNGAKMSAVGIVDPQDSSNYVMHIKNTQFATNTGESDNINILKTLPGDGIPYSEDSDIIIETRFKLASDNARMFLKFDLDGTNDILISNLNTFFVAKPDELNWRIKKSTWGDTGVAPVEETLAGQWLTAKVRIKGTSKTADYEIKTAENTYSATNIDAKVFNNVVNGKAEMGDALKNIAFKTWGNDEAYVDYVRVYKVCGASISVPETMYLDGSFDVTFDSQTVPSNLSDYFTVKDNAGAVVEDAVMTLNGNVLTVKVADEVADGVAYTLVIDKAGLEKSGYVLSGNAEYTVTASKYIVNDDFGANDINGWNVNGAKMSAVGIVDPQDSSNYVMHIKNTQFATNTGESDNINILKTLPGDGIPYSEDSDIIIETRFKLACDNARMFLKFDLDGTNDWLVRNTNTFFMASATELNWRIKKSTWGDTGVAPVEETLAGQWLTAKVRIKGTSKTADYEIKTAENTYTATNIDAKVFNNTVNGEVEMGDALKNIAFKTWGNDEAYVDYVRVYKANANDVIDIKLMANGEEAVTDGVISEGVSYVPYVNYIPASIINTEYTFITVLFKNGQVEAIKSFTNGETPEAIAVPETEDDYEIKLFLWKKDSMTPLCDSVDFREDNGNTHFFM